MHLFTFVIVPLTFILCSQLIPVIEAQAERPAQPEEQSQPEPQAEPEEVPETQTQEPAQPEAQTQPEEQPQEPAQSEAPPQLEPQGPVQPEAQAQPQALAQTTFCLLPCNLFSGPVCAMNSLQQCAIFASDCELNWRNCLNIFGRPFVQLPDVRECNGIVRGTTEACVRNCPGLPTCNNSENVTCASNRNGTLCGLFRSDCQRVRRGCTLNETFTANANATCLGLRLGEVGRCIVSNV